MPPHSTSKRYLTSACVTRQGTHRGNAPSPLTSRPAFGGEPVEIPLPQILLPHAEIVQIVPGINPGVVTVRKSRTQRIVAHRLDVGDRYIALADLQGFLSRPMAAHFGRRRIDAQEFVWKAKRAAVREADLEHARGL